MLVKLFQPVLISILSVVWRGERERKQEQEQEQDQEREAPGEEAEGGAGVAAARRAADLEGVQGVEQQGGEQAAWRVVVIHTKHVNGHKLVVFVNSPS